MPTSWLADRMTDAAFLMLIGVFLSRIVPH